MRHMKMTETMTTNGDSSTSEPWRRLTADDAGLILLNHLTQTASNSSAQLATNLLLLAYAIKTHSWSTSIISRVKLGQTTVQLVKRAGFNNVVHHLGLTTWHRSVSVRHQVFLQRSRQPPVSTVPLHEGNQ